MGTFAISQLLVLLSIWSLPHCAGTLPGQHNSESGSHGKFSRSSLEERQNIVEGNVTYVVLVDAGSTGSRVHVWRYRKNQPTFLDPHPIPEFLFPSNKKKISPGLSSFGSNPGAAGAYLRPLVEFAKEHVPRHLWAVTPFFVAGTAGLRLLRDEEITAILRSCEDFLRSESPFLVRPQNLRVIAGTEEGIFGWVSINYLAGRLPGMKHAGAGFLSAVEMGGASAQLTFPLPAASTASLQRHPQFHALEIGHARVQIYTHSYLGLGLDEVRSAFKARTLAAKAADPCLPAGFPTALAAPPSESPQDQQQQQQQQQPDGAKPGQSVEQQRGFAGCLEGVRRELGLVEPATCVERPCGLRGVHQPSFWREPGVLVAFEHFRHASAALGLLSEATQGPASEAETAWSAGLEDKPWEDRLSVARLRAAAEEVCGARWEEIVAKEGEGAGKYGRMRQGQEHEYCFRATYLWAFLAEGLGVPADTEFKALLELQGVDIDWALGMLLFVAAGAGRIDPDAGGGLESSAGATAWGAASEFELEKGRLAVLCLVILGATGVSWARRRGAKPCSGTGAEQSSVGTPSKMARSKEAEGPGTHVSQALLGMVSPVLSLIKVDSRGASLDALGDRDSPRRREEKEVCETTVPRTKMLRSEARLRPSTSQDNLDYLSSE